MATKDIGVCWCCNKNKARDMHHVLPVEFAGKMDGKQVPLCPTCHDTIHNIARAAIKGEALPATISDNERILVNYIVQQYNVFRSSGSVAEDARNMIQISCTVEEKAIAHDLKRQMGMKSLERMFKWLMFQEWERRKRT